MEMAKSVEEYLENIPQEWRPGVEKLRSLFAGTELKEELKWGIPNYTLDKKLVAGIGAFKNYFGVWFHQGVFLKDKEKVLINAQEGKTKGLRQWRMKDENFDEEMVLGYILEAIQNQKEGKAIKPEKPNKSKPFKVPTELVEAFEKDPSIQVAYNKLTPFKRKEHCEYIESAKRKQTRMNRLEKCIPLILQVKGLNDQYRK